MPVVGALFLLVFLVLASWPKADAAWGGLESRSAFKDGDFILGVLFPLHKAVKTNDYSRACGPVWEQYGIHRWAVGLSRVKHTWHMLYGFSLSRVEQFFRTIDEINADDSLLPNMTLGYDIRDSCWMASIAMERCIDFIRSKINTLFGEKSMSTNQGLTNAAQPISGRTFKTVAGSAEGKPIVALIGPGSSLVSVRVQNVLQLFEIPQVGYSATSMELSDKDTYKYFMRVVGSDFLQARALADIIKHHNWTFIQTIHTSGSYGASGIREFKTAVNEDRPDICVMNPTLELRKHEYLTESDYDNAVEKLRRYPKARVVVCFCQGRTITGLLKALIRRRLQRRFLIIGSDGWGVRRDVVEGIEQFAEGGMSIKLLSTPIGDFDDYFLNLRYPDNRRNPWFREFWEQKFNCTLEKFTTGRSDKKLCPDDLDLHNADREDQDSKLGFVVNAVYTVAHALHNMHRDVCGRNSVGLCAHLDATNGSQLFRYLMATNFTSTLGGDVISIDSKGDGPGRYEIMNFQRVKDLSWTPGSKPLDFGRGEDSRNEDKINSGEDEKAEYEYVSVGSWEQGKLNMYTDRIVWPDYSDSFKSVCSLPCKRGEVKKIQEGIKCCWTCEQCEPNAIVQDSFNCYTCPRGFWPNDHLTACLPLQVQYIRWSDTSSVLILLLSIAGMLVTVWVMSIFIGHNNTPVVKATTRELSYIILVSILITYASTFILVAKPHLVSCTLRRVVPSLALAFIYAALLTKTNRIARVLAAGKKRIMTRKPRFLSATAQLIITCLLATVQAMVVTATLLFETGDARLEYPTSREVWLVCNHSPGAVLVPLVFVMVLVFLCTFYAFKTRDLPENFNEAKFIGFTMYTTCVIWCSYLALYMGHTEINMSTSIANSLSATVALALLFGPKIYIINWHPQRNNRQEFTTTREIRCHIGGSASTPTGITASGALGVSQGGTNTLGVSNSQMSSVNIEHNKYLKQNNTCRKTNATIINRPKCLHAPEQNSVIQPDLGATSPADANTGLRRRLVNRLRSKFRSLSRPGSRDQQPRDMVLVSPGTAEWPTSRNAARRIAQNASPLVVESSRGCVCLCNECQAAGHHVTASRDIQTDDEMLANLVCYLKERLSIAQSDEFLNKIIRSKGSFDRYRESRERSTTARTPSNATASDASLTHNALERQAEVEISDKDTQSQQKTSTTCTSSVASSINGGDQSLSTNNGSTNQQTASRRPSAATLEAVDELEEVLISLLSFVPQVSRRMISEQRSKMLRECSCLACMGAENENNSGAAMETTAVEQDKSVTRAAAEINTVFCSQDGSNATLSTYSISSGEETTMCCDGTANDLTDTELSFDDFRPLQTSMEEGQLSEKVSSQQRLKNGQDSQKTAAVAEKFTMATAPRAVKEHTTSNSPTTDTASAHKTSVLGSTSASTSSTVSSSSCPCSPTTSITNTKTTSITERPPKKMTAAESRELQFEDSLSARGIHILRHDRDAVITQV